MKLVYPACFYPEDDGRYSVLFVDFELATFGNNLADAIRMAADAAAGRILCMLKDGEKLPNPTNLKNIKPETESGFVSMVYVDTGAEQPSGGDKLVSKNLTIPEWLNKAAGMAGINFSATLREALIEKLATK
ncbi:MAG: type II toxin-antitoxin system HicB family antitoxin [Clostridiales bacterium]|nr:type II toxin-antitoxin system HicB family antitoxin [Clostridiales bacterium]